MCNLIWTWNYSCLLQVNSHLCTGQRSVNWHTFRAFRDVPKALRRSFTHLYAVYSIWSFLTSCVRSFPQSRVKISFCCFILDRNTDTRTMTSTAKENCCTDTAVPNCTNTKHIRRSRVFIDCWSIWRLVRISKSSTSSMRCWKLGLSNMFENWLKVGYENFLWQKRFF